MKLEKILKYIFVSMLIFLMAFLAVRILMTSDRSTLDELYPTEAAAEAYKNDGAGAFVAPKLPYDMSEDGYFIAYSPVYCGTAKEFQITVRYNDSLSENYLEGSDPDNYYFELRDSEGNTVSKAEIVAEKERYFYNHLRLAFSDVEIDGESELYLFLCCDECTYPAEHTEGILIAHPSVEFKAVKLTSSEKEALAEKK